MSLVVLKFGGTSVGDGDAMRQSASIAHLAKSNFDQVVVVTSAMGKPQKIVTPSDNIKVTDTLLNAAKSAAAGDGDSYPRARRELADKHHAAINKVIASQEERRKIGDEIDQLLQGFEMLCGSVRVLGEVTPRALDAIGGLGERMAARILAGALRSMNVPAQSIDATEIIVTNANYLSAAPIMDITREKTRARLLPLLQQGIVPVVTGFIGATTNGIPTTLGRGGSDYSGSIVGAALDADEVHNFTDVNGVLSADPRIVPDAHTIEALSAQEMSELAFFGASVLHPLTIAPLVERHIPLRVKNTFNPTHAGTLISYEARAEVEPIKAVTSINKCSVVTLRGSGMAGVAGIAGRMFSAVARTGTSVYMFAQASSEQNITLVLPQTSAAKVKQELEREFARELENLAVTEVSVMDDVSIITAVGNGIASTPGVSGHVFSALGAKQINVMAIAQGSSECAISLVVNGSRSVDAMRALHELT
jgi:aspartate kinase